ncbi:MAG TPA: type II secretion system protein [Phycisphaerae bacterium]|nr:type II secretion system protein [Phycisphaerae bacterium]
MKGMDRAFTLVELLVVIGIIGLLMAMLTPSFVTVTDLARETTCRNNLQLISKSVGAYLIAHNDLLPCNDPTVIDYGYVDPNLLLPGRDSTMKWWCNKVYGYGTRKPKVYVCPSDAGRANDIDPVECGYGANNTLTDPSPGGEGVKTSFEIRDTERTAIVGHCSLYSNEPMIHQNMVSDKMWPRGHLRRYDKVSKEVEGRCGFIMANGSVAIKTFAQAAETLDADGNMVLFHK